MKDILSKKDCRQLNLVERLYSDQHWITSACLAEELDCSLRILKSDIQQLNEEFAEFLIESSYEGIRLKFKPNMSMQTVYQTFLLRSKVYDLYQLIYRNEQYSLHELAQDLLISESTLRRLLKSGRHYLKEYFNLSIQSNPYRYVGDERSIRYFGYQLFTEDYLPGEWPVDEISQQEMDHFIELVAEKLQLQVPYTSLRRLKTLLAVNAIRI